MSAWQKARAAFTLAVMEESLRNLLASPSSWPDWVVTACLVVLGIVAVWLLMKVLKWTFFLALALLGLVAVCTAVGWLLS